MKLGIVLILAGVVLGSPAARADQDQPMNAPDEPTAAATPESRLNDGLALADTQDWRGAEAAFRDAIRLRSAFPEAWNGLGHALRMQKNYAESVASYQEALRLRPDYPQALEYLGEAYVQLGKLDEARALLRRLRALDPAEAAVLAAVIDGGGKASRRWQDAVAAAGVAAELRVGICSWADPALIEAGSFYPKKSMSAEARLRFYAAAFDTVEVDSAYYAIPAAATAVRWVERTPPGFLFNIKAYAPMTGHHARPESLPAELQLLLPPAPRRTPRGEIHRSAFGAEALAACFRLYGAAIAPLAAAGKLGYVLFQLAPWVRFGDRALAYLASLPARLPGLTLAVEFRDRSWFPEHARETLAALRAAGLAHVVVDGPEAAGAVPRVAGVTAPTAVLRLHGRNAEGWLRQRRGEAPSVREKYDYLYTEAELQALRPEIQELEAESERVFIAFNNNNRDYPVQNARMMRRLLGAPAPESLPGGRRS